MLRFVTGALCCALLYSCSSRPVLVKPAFADSLLGHYQPAKVLNVVQGDLAFWKQRVDSLPFDISNQQKWAVALAERFQLTGNVHDLITADSILTGLNLFYAGKEPGILLTLAHLKMTRHQFPAAKVLIDSVVAQHAMRYAATMASFDADFELGNEALASNLLHRVDGKNDFGYLFRLAKLEHGRGNADSAIAYMARAARMTESPIQKAAALSNEADLELHGGNAAQAAALYRECLRLHPSDFHSISGLGRIALVHDGNVALATRIFAFVGQQHQSPEPLWRLAQAQELSNPTAALSYAHSFVKKASAPAYGNMYNKYLIDLYTGILNKPAEALAVAERERGNRATPQTAAWLAWSLAAAGKKEEAYAVYKKDVAGHPLETLELFWMGKMMMVLGKGFDAQQFFEAARENRYDLSPRQQQELEAALK
ncbi:MAG: tetratricopeptide repeat protein [Chitinophagaceae bacterium]|nr:MAG: tetratricopeptide repeat protein [Chitinophagaceae bacterium]